MGKLRTLADWVWYPWLAALFPIVFLFSRNFDKVLAVDVAGACGVTAAAVGVLVGLFWAITRDWHKAAAMTLALVIPFFAYGPLRDTLSSTSASGSIQTPVFLLPIILVIGVATAIVVGLWAPAGLLRKAASSLNVLSAALLLFNLGTLVVGQAQVAAASRGSGEAPVERSSAPKVDNDSRHPDVYYIILDAYPSNSSLMEESEIDNSHFTDELEKRGFLVAYDSKSNYPITTPSMASSLNMRYLERGEGPGGKAGVNYLRRLVSDNAVAQELQSRGYTYIFVMYSLDKASRIADFNVDHYADGNRYFPGDGPPPSDAATQPFWPLLIDSTMLAEADLDLSALSQAPGAPTDWQDPKRVLAALDEGPRIAQRPEATFTVLHIIMPHIPIRFTRDGEIIWDPAEYRRANKTNRRQAFIDQLSWFNERVLQMVDDINSQSSTPPIIIIQGDHGSRLGSLKVNGEARFFKILNAYSFPGAGGQAQLTQDITPVNTFRVMFNTYFGASYDLLDSRQFQLPELYDDPLNLMEVTEP